MNGININQYADHTGIALAIVHMGAPWVGFTCPSDEGVR